MRQSSLVASVLSVALPLTALLPAAATAGAIEETLPLGSAVLIGSVNGQPFHFEHAYSHLVEEGATAVEHFTVVVIADRELSPGMAQDLGALRAQARAGDLRALLFELNDGTGEFRTQELLGPEGFARPIVGDMTWSAETWDADRIIGSIYFYQGTDWGFAGPFKTITRLGPPLAVEQATGTMIDRGESLSLGQVQLREWTDGDAPMTSLVFTEQPFDWSFDPDPDAVRAGIAQLGIPAFFAVVGSADGLVHVADCLGRDGERAEAAAADWTREEWDEGVMRGRLGSEAGAPCQVTAYFAATVR